MAKVISVGEGKWIAAGVGIRQNWTAGNGIGGDDGEEPEGRRGVTTMRREDRREEGDEAAR